MEQNYIMIYWLVAGVVLFVAEMATPTVGLMFAGCGALTVGMMLNLSLISGDEKLLQMLIFFVATIIWTLILWKPIQKLRQGKNKTQYHNIIGATAIVGEKGINKIHGGTALWSGTIMKAKFAENVDVENLESGALVIVKDIAGNTLIVTPKK